MTMRDLIPWGRRRTPSLRGDEPLHPMLTLHREMNRLFDDVFRAFDNDLPAGFAWPKLDVVETDGAYRVLAELPGLDEKDVELSLQDGVLTLQGEKKVEHDGEGALHSERFHGRFRRSLQLARDIDQDKVSATFRNGVLTVVLPKSAEAAHKARRIPVSSK